MILKMGHKKRDFGLSTKDCPKSRTEYKPIKSSKLAKILIRALDKVAFEVYCNGENRQNSQRSRLGDEDYGNSKAVLPRRAHS